MAERAEAEPVEAALTWRVAADITAARLCAVARIVPRLSVAAPCIAAAIVPAWAQPALLSVQPLPGRTITTTTNVDMPRIRPATELTARAAARSQHQSGTSSRAAYTGRSPFTVTRLPERVCGQ